MFTVMLLGFERHLSLAPLPLAPQRITERAKGTIAATSAGLQRALHVFYSLQGS